MAKALATKKVGGAREGSFPRGGRGGEFLARLVSMDGAIDFDDEFERRAVEVDDESSDDVLTSKLEARELAFSYSAPELGLGWRGVASHLPGMFEFRSGSRPRP